MNRSLAHASGKDGRPSPRVASLWIITLLVPLVFTVLVAPASAGRRQSQDPYPAPAVPGLNPVETLAPAADAAEPYPGPATGTDAVMGGDAPDIVAPSTSSDQSGSQRPSPAGLYFLWGSFLAALLIFATAVVGSVVLFARRVE